MARFTIEEDVSSLLRLTSRTSLRHAGVTSYTLRELGTSHQVIDRWRGADGGWRFTLRVEVIGSTDAIMRAHRKCLAHASRVSPVHFHEKELAGFAATKLRRLVLKNTGKGTVADALPPRNVPVHAPYWFVEREGMFDFALSDDAHTVR